MIQSFYSLAAFHIVDCLFIFVYIVTTFQKMSYTGKKMGHTTEATAVCLQLFFHCRFCHRLININLCDKSFTVHRIVGKMSPSLYPSRWNPMLWHFGTLH